MTYLTKRCCIGLAVSLSLFTSVTFASPSASWKPMASDKLISLPANIIEKRVEQDFSASPMSMRVTELDQKMSNKVNNIKALQPQIIDLEGEEKLNHQYEVLKEKSDYLDLLQESHDLRQQTLSKKQNVYVEVLDKLHRKRGKDINSQAYQLKEAQDKARARMESTMAQVDNALMLSGYEKSSPYADAYAINLDKIEKMKQAIAEHRAKAAPQLAGMDVSSEEYIRQLLSQVSSEQSLLDQESLLLGYMAQLVALDAQSLQYEVEEEQGDGSVSLSDASNASFVADLFL
ncbi:hypothetical protein QX776_03245 [Alteromonadaceae bacterium BrNp21-10]|nr:hypothetical protein [Alteromonadaceae bacterium BrNp21-10]